VTGNAVPFVVNEKKCFPDSAAPQDFGYTAFLPFHHVVKLSPSSLKHVWEVLIPLCASWAWQMHDWHSDLSSAVRKGRLTAFQVDPYQNRIFVRFFRLRETSKTDNKGLSVMLCSTRVRGIVINIIN